MTARRITSAMAAFSHSWWPIFIIGLLISTVLYQRWQVTHAHAQVTLKQGDQLPPAILETTNGKAINVNWRFSGGSTIVYVFEPHCVWCAKNRESLSALREGAPNYRFVGLSLKRDGLTEYLRDKPLAGELVYVVPEKARRLLKLNRTPTTLLISEVGTVSKVWPGVYAKKTKTDLEKTFGIVLPTIDLNLPTVD